MVTVYRLDMYFSHLGQLSLLHSLSTCQAAVAVTLSWEGYRRPCISIYVLNGLRHGDEHFYKEYDTFLKR